MTKMEDFQESYQEANQASFQNRLRQNLLDACHTTIDDAALSEQPSSQELHQLLASKAAASSVISLCVSEFNSHAEAMRKLLQETVNAELDDHDADTAVRTAVFESLESSLDEVERKQIRVVKALDQRTRALIISVIDQCLAAYFPFDQPQHPIDSEVVLEGFTDAVASAVVGSEANPEELAVQQSIGAEGANVYSAWRTYFKEVRAKQEKCVVDCLKVLQLNEVMPPEIQDIAKILLEQTDTAIKVS